MKKDRLERLDLPFVVTREDLRKIGYYLIALADWNDLPSRMVELGDPSVVVTDVEIKFVGALWVSVPSIPKLTPGTTVEFYNSSTKFDAKIEFTDGSDRLQPNGFKIPPGGKKVVSVMEGPDAPVRCNVWRRDTSSEAAEWFDCTGTGNGPNMEIDNP